jgi:hypothetical protein
MATPNATFAAFAAAPTCPPAPRKNRDHAPRFEVRHLAVRKIVPACAPVLRTSFPICEKGMIGEPS